MKTKFDCAWLGKGTEIGGRVQKTRWQFEYAGLRHFIPVIYHFEEGIIFDVVTLLEEEQMRNFFAKYEGDEDDFSPQKQMDAERDHPYHPASIQNIWLNGRQIEGGFSSSSCVYSKWNQQDREGKTFQKAYASILQGSSCFACQRYQIPFDTEPSGWERFIRRFFPKKLKTLRIETEPFIVYYPVEGAVEICPDELETAVSSIVFQHPVTGQEHTVMLSRGKEEELPINFSGFPQLYCASAYYEITPPLSKGEQLQFQTAMQEDFSPEESPVPEDACSVGVIFSPERGACEECMGSDETENVESVGIIGSADGPTAILIATQNSEEMNSGGLPLASCCSVPSTKKPQTYRFEISSIQIQASDRQIFEF
ncbi:hypothetical protein [Clostridium minihomine]|uniref:hypothetical protein n=1 Tax=Clostridium minihomine TaxID=2045012 RepID=UPI000C783D03|nr:hypothetical protein [Clostridium minihomine]